MPYWYSGCDPEAVHPLSGPVIQFQVERVFSPGEYALFQQARRPQLVYDRCVYFESGRLVFFSVMSGPFRFKVEFEPVENGYAATGWACAGDTPARDHPTELLWWLEETLLLNTPTTRGSWKNQPMPERRELLPVARTFSPAEFEDLKLGLLPRQMEDKWFIFYEGGWLYFHRSWTGFCIFQVRIEPKGGRYGITEAWANRDPEQRTRASPQEEGRILERLLDSLIGPP